MALRLSPSPSVLINLEQRSQEQSAYYFAVVVPALARAWRLGKPAAHARVKDQFMGGQSTASLTTIDFENLMERLRLYARRRHGIQIPLPNFTGAGNSYG